MCSWWDVSQALAEGTSMVPSCLWLIRDRWTVTSPKVVLKVNGRVPRCVDTGAGFAAAVLQDQLLVGLLDEGSEEPALDLKAGLMDERLDLVGEVLVLDGTGNDIPSDSCSEKAWMSRWTGPRLMESEGRRWHAWCISIPVLWGSIVRAFLSLGQG